MMIILQKVPGLQLLSVALLCCILPEQCIELVPITKGILLIKMSFQHYSACALSKDSFRLLLHFYIVCVFCGLYQIYLREQKLFLLKSCSYVALGGVNLGLNPVCFSKFFFGKSVDVGRNFSK